MSDEVADQVVAYLGAGLAALGALPTRDRLVIERVFDEAEGTQLIVHSPYGGRINRALGLALRKRFCVSFDFELQAAADDDTVVLSLGPQHSFPLTQVPSMLQSGTAHDVLVQAVLPHPMLAARWRWNLNRALVVPRSRGGTRRPIHLQRMEADDLLAATWPALAACQENAPPGPVPVPDHVLVRQTVDDCLTEPLDADGLVALLAEIEAGRVAIHFVGVGRALAPGPRDPDRQTLHLPRRRSARGAPHPGRGRAPRPRGSGSRRSPARATGRRRGSWPPSNRRPRPRSSTRSARPRATPTSSTICCSPSSCAGRSPTGAPGSPNWWPTVGPDSWAATGPPPSGRPRRSSSSPR